MIPIFFENAHSRLYILLMYMYIPSSNLPLYVSGINWIHDVSFYDTEHTILIANFKRVILQICDLLRYSTTSSCCICECLIVLSVLSFCTYKCTICYNPQIMIFWKAHYFIDISPISVLIFHTYSIRCTLDTICVSLIELKS